MPALQNAAQELESWFFETYIPHWVAVGSGQSEDGPEFILDYWGTPMFVCAPPSLRAWLTTDEQVIEFLKYNHLPLQQEGYSHTVIPDRSVTMYSEFGGAIEVIWSRRRADESEIERIAVHWEIGRLGDDQDAKWKVLGIQAKFTTKDTLAEAWLEENDLGNWRDDTNQS